MNIIILPPPTKTPRRNLGFGLLPNSFEIKNVGRVVDISRRFTAWIFDRYNCGLLKEEGDVLGILLSFWAQGILLLIVCRSLGNSPILLLKEG